MEDTVPSQQSNQKVKLIVLICCLTFIVISILFLAFLSQNKKQSVSTVSPPSSRPTETFQNPFAQEAANPFVTESGYQNPFETTTSGGQEYRNPFENLK